MGHCKLTRAAIKRLTYVRDIEYCMLRLIAIDPCLMFYSYMNFEHHSKMYPNDLGSGLIFHLGRTRPESKSFADARLQLIRGTASVAAGGVLL